MTSDARAALDALVAALEAHLDAAQQRRGEMDPQVERAYRALAEAFEAYDEALYDAYDEVTPFVLYDDQEDEREDDDLDDEDDDVVDVDEEDLFDDDEDDLPEVDPDEDGQAAETSSRA
ncbi:MAG: primosomal protein [Actinomycetota bacterium]